MLDLRRGRGGGGHTDAALHRHACMQQRQQAVRFVVQEIVQDNKQLGQEFPSGAGAAACISTQLAPVPACSSSAARLHQQCFLCCSTTVSNKATERGAGEGDGGESGRLLAMCVRRFHGRHHVLRVSRGSERLTIVQLQYVTGALQLALLRAWPA